LAALAAFFFLDGEDGLPSAGMPTTGATATTGTGAATMAGLAAFFFFDPVVGWTKD